MKLAVNLAGITLAAWILAALAWVGWGVDGPGSLSLASRYLLQTFRVDDSARCSDYHAGDRFCRGEMASP
jgi:hypothetical protein